jgi:hypothetical protein
MCPNLRGTEGVLTFTFTFWFFIIETDDTQLDGWNNRHKQPSAASTKFYRVSLNIHVSRPVPTERDCAVQFWRPHGTISLTKVSQSPSPTATWTGSGTQDSEPARPPACYSRRNADEDRGQVSGRRKRSKDASGTIAL